MSVHMLSVWGKYHRCRKYSVLFIEQFSSGVQAEMCNVLNYSPGRASCDLNVVYS